MTDFHIKVLNSINTSVERISFRKDKWGEIATVYYGGVTKSTTIGDDHDKDEWETFIETVKQGSRYFISEAKKVYGSVWKKHIKNR